MSEYADGFDDGKGEKFDELMVEIVTLREQLAEKEKVLEQNRVTKLGIDAMIDNYLRLEAENATLRLKVDAVLREQLKDCSAAFDRQQEQLDRNAEQLAALRKDASSKWAFLEWRDRAEKAEAENAALREQLKQVEAGYATRNDEVTGLLGMNAELREQLAAAIDAAKEEGK